MLVCLSSVYPDLHQNLWLIIFKLGSLRELKLPKLPTIMCEPGRALVAEGGSVIIELI